MCRGAGEGMLLGDDSLWNGTHWVFMVTAVDRLGTDRFASPASYLSHSLISWKIAG